MPLPTTPITRTLLVRIHGIATAEFGDNDYACSPDQPFGEILDFVKNAILDNGITVDWASTYWVYRNRDGSLITEGWLGTDGAFRYYEDMIYGESQTVLEFYPCVTLA